MSKLNSALPEQQVHPEPAFEKRSRRTFSADYKLKIIQQAENCLHGELGELLRRERLYHNPLNEWRKEFEAKGIEGMNKSAPDQKRIVFLEKENFRLKKQLQLKDDYLALQKKSLRHAPEPGEREQRIMMVLETRGSHLSLSESCRVLGVNKSTVYSRLVLVQR